MTETRNEESVWTAPTGARFEPLERLSSEPPAVTRGEELEAEASQGVRARVEAYRTPVTRETMRRSVP